MVWREPAHLVLAVDEVLRRSGYGVDEGLEPGVLWLLLSGRGGALAVDARLELVLDGGPVAVELGPESGAAGLAAPGADFADAVGAAAVVAGLHGGAVAGTARVHLAALVAFSHGLMHSQPPG